MSWESFRRFCKTLMPGWGHQEKIEYLRGRTEYRLARQREISIAQDFVHRGRYRGGIATLCIVASVLGWCAVFTLGKSISATPFQLLLNVVSVTPTSVPALPPASANTSPRPPFVEMGSTSLPGDGCGTEWAGPPLLQSPKPPEKSSEHGTGGSFSALSAGSLNVARVTAFIRYFGVKGEFSQLVVAALICLLTHVYTNMLILSCLASLVGSLCNYSVQALKQAREFAQQAIVASAAADPANPPPTGSPTPPPTAPPKPSVFGHRRVFSNFSATVVTGLSLGFAAFLACASGTLLFPKLAPVGTPDGYQNAVCVASLLAYILALFPDTALLVIENRVNTASALAMAAQRNLGSAFPNPPPPGPPIVPPGPNPPPPPASTSSSPPPPT